MRGFVGTGIFPYYLRGAMLSVKLCLLNGWVG